MASDLKPCPFCGGEAFREYAHIPEGNYHSKECHSCNVAALEMSDEEWNRRAPVTPIPVSEPPGDNDIVLPLWKAKDQDDPLFWTWFRPMRGIEMDLQHQRPASLQMTHYLLLKKGEL